MPKEIWITDTTFRDGQQSTSPFTVEQSVHLYKLMHSLGGPKGIIRQSEFFVHWKGSRVAAALQGTRLYDFPGDNHIRASEKDFQLVKESARPACSSPAQTITSIKKMG